MNLTILNVIFLVWNIVVFSMYAIEKSRSKTGKWRISEKALIIPALIGGGLGAFLGMRVFRHKTRHRLFVILLPIGLLLSLLLYFFCFLLTTGRFFEIFP